MFFVRQIILIKEVVFFVFTSSGQGVEKEDASYWCSESTSAASSVDSSEYNSDDGFIDINDEDLKMSSFSVSLLMVQLSFKTKKLC